MAHVRREGHEVAPRVAASAIRDFVAVRAASGFKDKVVLAPSANFFPYGVTIASAASPGDPLAIQREGVAKVLCVASVGANVEVGVASNNGGIGPVSGASGGVVHAIGESTEAADAGSLFSVQLRPRQLSGTP